jgi:hypothetical protein
MAYIDVEVREFRQISGAEVVEFSALKIKKLNRTAQGMFINFTLKAADIDNDMQVAVKLSKKQGGEYRQLPYKLPPSDLCDFFNEDKYAMPDLVKVSNVPYPLPCPAPQVGSSKLFLVTNPAYFSNCR